MPNKHKVTYKFETDGIQKELPKSITRQLPEEEEHVKGDKVTPPVLRNTMISVDDGVWLFDNWSPKEIENLTEDTTFVGTWKYYPHQASLNEVPTIHAEDKILIVGDSFDAMKDVTASDKEDGDITDKIEIIENTVDTSKTGAYTVLNVKFWDPSTAQS